MLSLGLGLGLGFNFFHKEWQVNKSQLIETDIKIQLPEGCYGRIAPRSGLALNMSVDVLAGVIDADYRGPIKVLLLSK